jgi:hypothetical protein
MVPTFGSTTDDPGVGVLDQVIVRKTGVVITSDLPVETESEPISISTIDGEVSPTEEAPALPETTSVPAKKTEEKNPPEGYWDTMSELHSMTRVPPGHDLLFSIPINHVGPTWFLRVGVLLDVSEPRVGEGPYIELDFSRWQIPTDARTVLAPKAVGPSIRPDQSH